MAAGRSGCVGAMNTTNKFVNTPKQDWAFYIASALLFIASAGVTISSCMSMSGGMAMPGGWIMSMAWMRMGQTWLSAAGSFLEMWVVMMAAMMLPTLIPALLRYRVSLRGSKPAPLHAATALAGAGYFLVWALLGAVVYPAGVVVTNAEMSSPTLARSVPLITGAVLLLAGGLQFTAWKARQLCRCRDGASCLHGQSPDARSAWRHGLRLGADCVSCCIGLMMALLATGVMNLGAMAIITAVITAERLAPSPNLVARIAGAVLITAGVFMIAQGASHAWSF